MKKKNLLLIFSLILTLIISGCGNKNSTKTDNKESKNVGVTQENNTNKKEILVYSGAGLKKPMEALKSEFEKKNRDISINIIYSGSGQLLSQLEQSGKGDLFIVGSKPTYDAAMEKKLAEEGRPVAFHTPAIIVAKGNPKKITGLNDLNKDGLKLAIGEPSANAIGKTSIKMFEKSKITNYEKNIVVKTSTVNELYQAITNGNADAAIVTKDSAYGNDKVDLVEIEKDQLIDQVITAGILTTTENKNNSQLLLDFLTGEYSKTVFKSYGFAPLK